MACSALEFHVEMASSHHHDSALLFLSLEHYQRGVHADQKASGTRMRNQNVGTRLYPLKRLASSVHENWDLQNRVPPPSCAALLAGRRRTAFSLINRMPERCNERCLSHSLSIAISVITSRKEARLLSTVNEFDRKLNLLSWSRKTLFVKKMDEVLHLRLFQQKKSFDDDLDPSTQNLGSLPFRLMTEEVRITFVAIKPQRKASIDIIVAPSVVTTSAAN